VTTSPGDQAGVSRPGLRSVIFSAERVHEPTRELLAEFGLVEGEADDSSLEQCEVLLAFPFRVKGDLIRRMKNLRAIQVQSAGVDGMEFSAVPSGVRVYSNSGGYTGPVTEQAWALVLGMAKGVNVHNKKVPPRLLKGKTLLVLGCGSIGCEVARIGRAAFAMRTMGISRGFNTPELFDEKHDLGELATVIGSADFIVDALPLSRATRSILSYEVLRLMKPDVVLANVGRGETVDAAAIERILRERPETRFGTDVFWRSNDERREVFDTPLWDLANFGGTLHSAVLEKQDAIAEAQLMAAENIRRFLRTGSALHEVDLGDYVPGLALGGARKADKTPE
jgi:D-3-phosphoglycerate dehydrogenase